MGDARKFGFKILGHRVQRRELNAKPYVKQGVKVGVTQTSFHTSSTIWILITSRKTTCRAGTV